MSLKKQTTILALVTATEVLVFGMKWNTSTDLAILSSSISTV